MNGHVSGRTASPEVALQNLRALLEVNGEIARAHGGVHAHVNAEVASVLQAVIRSAALQRDELHRLINEWEQLFVEVAPNAGTSGPDPMISAREIVESWLDIKENAARLYRKAAEDAPTRGLRVRLLALAEEEELHVARLRRLL